jgi:hypothetical protein
MAISKPSESRGNILQFNDCLGISIGINCHYPVRIEIREPEFVIVPSWAFAKRQTFQKNFCLKHHEITPFFTEKVRIIGFRKKEEEFS